MNKSSAHKSIDVSYILCVFNGEKFLRNTLDSLLNQKRVSSEIIAVNDGSTDQSLSILRKYAQAHTNIRIVSQPNQGLSVARNNGIKLAKGRYIASAAQGDIYHAEKTFEQIKYLEVHHLDFCFSQIGLVNNDDEPITNCKLSIYNRPFWIKPLLLFDIIFNMPICSPSFLCRRTCYEKLIWSPAIFLFQDYQLWIKMFLHFKGGKVPKVLFQKRFEENEEQEKYIKTYTLPFHFLEHRAAIISAFMIQFPFLYHIPIIFQSFHVAKRIYEIEMKKNANCAIEKLSKLYTNIGYDFAGSQVQKLKKYLQ